MERASRIAQERVLERVPTACNCGSRLFRVATANELEGDALPRDPALLWSGLAGMSKF